MRTLGSAALAALAALGLAASSVPVRADPYAGMPRDKGREQVLVYCGPCHSLRLVAQQGLSRETWDETFVQMTKEHGMAPLPAGDRALVLEYLVKHLGPDHRWRPAR